MEEELIRGTVLRRNISVNLVEPSLVPGLNQGGSAVTVGVSTLKPRPDTWNLNVIYDVMSDSNLEMRLLRAVYQNQGKHLESSSTHLS